VDLPGTHLPSGMYRRIVKGIFFSRSSIIAICASAHPAVASELCQQAGTQQDLLRLLTRDKYTTDCMLLLHVAHPGMQYRPWL
jgi:hypothetical protein